MTRDLDIFFTFAPCCHGNNPIGMIWGRQLLLNERGLQLSYLGRISKKEVGPSKAKQGVRSYFNSLNKGVFHWAEAY